MSLRALAQAIMLEALYQETTYFSRMVGRRCTEPWLYGGTGEFLVLFMDRETWLQKFPHVLLENEKAK